MNRVYLLLRDNIESGPFSFDELLQQQLRSSDLIWIEGETNAWIYPYEIEDLRKSLTGKTVEQVSLPAVVPSSAKIQKPEIKNVNQEATKPSGIPVKAPKKTNDEIEKRAEELRKKALAFSSQHDFHQQPVLRPIHDFQPHLNERDSVNLVHHKPNNGLPIGEVLVAAMVIGLVITGWYGGANKYFFNQKAPVVNSVATQLVASDTHAAAAAFPKKSTAYADSVTASVDSAATNNGNATTVFQATTKKTPSRLAQDSPFVEKKNDLAVQNNIPDTESKESSKSISEEKKPVENIAVKEPEKKPVVTEEKKSSEIKKETDTKEAVKNEEDKKKTIGDVFKGLFKKKHKNQD
jgi:hypothetical protein